MPITPPDPPEKILYLTAVTAMRRFGIAAQTVSNETWDSLPAREKSVWVAVAKEAEIIFATPPTLKNS